MIQTSKWYRRKNGTDGQIVVQTSKLCIRSKQGGTKASTKVNVVQTVKKWYRWTKSGTDGHKYRYRRQNGTDSEKLVQMTKWYRPSKSAKDVKVVQTVKK